MRWSKVLHIRRIHFPGRCRKAPILALFVALLSFRCGAGLDLLLDELPQFEPWTPPIILPPAISNISDVNASQCRNPGPTSDISLRWLGPSTQHAALIDRYRIYRIPAQAAAPYYLSVELLDLYAGNNICAAPDLLNAADCSFLGGVDYRWTGVTCILPQVSESGCLSNRPGNQWVTGGDTRLQSDFPGLRITELKLGICSNRAQGNQSDCIAAGGSWNPAIALYDTAGTTNPADDLPTSIPAGEFSCTASLLDNEVNCTDIPADEGIYYYRIKSCSTELGSCGAYSPASIGRKEDTSITVLPITLQEANCADGRCLDFGSTNTVYSSINITGLSWHGNPVANPGTLFWSNNSTRVAAGPSALFVANPNTNLLERYTILSQCTNNFAGNINEAGAGTNCDGSAAGIETAINTRFETGTSASSPPSIRHNWTLSASTAATWNGGSTPFFYPAAVAIDATGNTVAIADRFNHRILIKAAGFSGTNTSAPDRVIGSFGSDLERLVQPTDVELTADGADADTLPDFAVVLDSGNALIKVFEVATGNFVYAFGGPGSDNNSFLVPSAITYTDAVTAGRPDARVYVSDTGNNRIVGLDATNGCGFAVANPTLSNWLVNNLGDIAIDNHPTATSRRLYFIDGQNRQVRTPVFAPQSTATPVYP